MKSINIKKLSILLYITIIILTMTGCGSGSGSVGIIGGADGPTAVYIANSNKFQEYSSKKEPVKLVRIGGHLYYDTDENSNINGRCGNLDGNFKKAVESYEIPQNDNESNFELDNNYYCGYQFGMKDDTIEIPIDNNWKIFKKIYDTEKDVTQYKYIMKLDGKTQYSFCETKYIVLTNDMDITANDAAKSMLSSLADDYIDIYIVSFEND